MKNTPQISVHTTETAIARSKQLDAEIAAEFATLTAEEKRAALDGFLQLLSKREASPSPQPKA